MIFDIHQIDAVDKLVITLRMSSGRSEQKHERGESREAGLRLHARGDARLHVREEEAGRRLVVPPRRVGATHTIDSDKSSTPKQTLNKPLNTP